MFRKILPPLIITAVFALGLLAGRQFWTDAQPGTQRPQLAVATLMPQGRALPNFSLTASNGGRLGQADLSGNWTVVFMGFTNCGHICPTTLFTVQQAVSQLNQRPQVLFVSVDPNRDTPEIINKYLAGFDPDFLGATGSKAELDKLAAGLGAPYLVSQENGLYTVDHSGALFLLDPQGRYRGTLTPPHDAKLIAEDLRKILTQS